MNLANLTESEDLKGFLVFEAAFHTETGIYYPGDRIKITVSKNNLHGGYCGNTLLKEVTSLNRETEFDIRIEEFLFSKCSLEFNINQSVYGLSRKNGYLRLNAKIDRLK